MSARRKFKCVCLIDEKSWKGCFGTDRRDMEKVAMELARPQGEAVAATSAARLDAGYGARWSWGVGRVELQGPGWKLGPSDIR